ncbi:MAG: hypothetical protein JWN14_236 [Chthonomonadales bacterium]|nr:hypothetical protein [Chthonomonadales bacterium]
MLEVSLFGSLEAKRDGRSLCTHWTRHSHRLLALLTLNHNCAVSTDWILSALLLPETVLPQSLKELFRILGDEDRHRIHHRNRQIHFDTSGVQVDLFTFQELIARNTLETLALAVTLHRGGLLKDWEEEGWFCEERESSLAEYLDALNTLTQAALEAQDYGRAASLLRRYVNAYPEMDSAWARLVEVYRMTDSTAEIAVTQQRYLAALRKRCAAEGREITPSPRVLRACEQAVPGAKSPSVLSAADTERQAAYASICTSLSSKAAETAVFEPVGGAVPPGSPFYIVRPADAQAFDALARRDSFLLVKGARQVGKSSLLACLIHKARESGAQVVRSDWQKLPQATLETERTFLRVLADTFVDHLDLDANPDTHFESGRAGTTSFERFLKRDVLPVASGSLVWVIDEADRLFDRPFRDDVFAMLRSWHGERAVDFTGRWQKLTVILAYATEAYLFISNLDQSPFNVGTHVELDDFTRAQVGDMKRRYGMVLREEREVDRLYALVGGHPYLVRRCLQEMRRHGLKSMADVEASVERGDSFFRDHLGRIRLALLRDPEMEGALRAYLNDGKPPDLDLFVRLRAAGVMRGDSPREMRPRCRLYDLSLRRVFA